MHLLVALVIGALLAACANIGRPDGGPHDEDPPVFVSSNPMPGALNVNRNTLQLNFDENIQLEDAFNKVVVSPVQKQTPSVTSNGKRISVELKDTLLPNTTYTIDFADCIKDLNEGNILDGFALDFSTGESIDTLRISGMVLQAENLEPAQSIYVGIYSNLADSAITTLPFERIARTNQYGQFTLRNLKPGNYRIYALNDLNRDYKWDRSEDVAFYDVTVSPSVEYFTVTDTLLDANHADSLIHRPGIRYLPNDILLSAFNENYKAQYLQDYSRPERNRILINLAAPDVDSLPQIHIVDGANDGLSIDRWALASVNKTRDSLEYWINDKDVLATDSLRLSVKYLRTDSTDNLAWQTDTLRFFFKEPKADKKKKKKDEEEVTDSIPKIDYMDFKSLTGGAQDVYCPMYFEAAHPIRSIDSLGVRLQAQKDTLWVDIPDAKLEVDSLNPLRRVMFDYKWTPGQKYKAIVDSAAITGIYDLYNKKFEQEFTVKDLAEYSNLILKVQGVDSAAVVQLLNSSDTPIREVELINGRAEFKYINPGTYYARLFLDNNHNGKWDTGNLLDSIQPEEVYYYPKKLDLKKNWDVDQSWNIYELPVDKQKPYAILKNKPKLKSGEKAPEDEKSDEDDEDFDSNFNGYNGNSYNNKRNSNSSSSNSYNRSGFQRSSGY
jgi:uncharacterized protein (DUF2141 family)